MDTLKLKLVRKEQPVELEGPDGTSTTYTLRELTGKGRDAWIEQNNAQTQRDDTGAVKVISTKGVTARLIAACLFDTTGAPVPEATIDEWPMATVNTLFGACQDLNGLRPAPKNV